MARHLQGASRHDNPRRYGALYAARRPVSAVAEWMRQFTGRRVGALAFEPRPGARIALVELDDSALSAIPELDDPHELLDRGLRPSQVATRIRKMTQRQALAIYEEGASGFAWWSAVESSWINVTLFADRTVEAMTVGEPSPLTTEHPAVVEAAGVLAVPLDVGQSPRK
ncbi:MAG TPA: RES family NAD+ phosphorylase [Actinomycetota bacterium]|nr:RES family NAD+ phosphorylase [Actinomycetota bacterium]